MNDSGFRILRTSETDLCAEDRRAISVLLRASFPEYPEERIYFPQPPHTRLLHWEGRELTGHLGIVIRDIRVGGNAFQVMGVADLCTAADRVGEGVATRLLEQMETLARSCSIPFLMAMALTSGLFSKVGFRPIDVRCTWLAYLNGRSLGLFHRTPPSGLMVKSVGAVDWPEGDVDLMGPLF